MTNPINSSPSDAGDTFFGSIGYRAYSDNFDYVYCDLHNFVAKPLRFDEKQCVLFPDRLLRIQDDFIRGRNVVLIGNASSINDVRIMSDDIVVCINRMYGGYDPISERVDVWAGLPKSELFTQEDGKPTLFQTLLPTIKRFWIVSPFEISTVWLRAVVSDGALDRVLVMPAGELFLDQVAFQMPLSLKNVLRRYSLRGGPSGISEVNLLLSGVKLLWFVLLNKPASIRVYGFDFYRGDRSMLWPGHWVRLNRIVFRWLLNRASRKKIIVCDANLTASQASGE